MDNAALKELDSKRLKYKAQVAAALEEEEDPLAAYHQFIKWTIDHYTDKLLAHSGLLELLEEATRQFKDDSAYKGDLRYLRLWSLYASYVEDPTIIYSFLLSNSIGTIYAQVYEEFAAALEGNGRRTDAEKVYQLGIQRRARPLERLKKRYAEFQSRPPTSRRSNTQSNSIWREAPPQTQALRKEPLRNYSSKPSSSQQPSNKPATASTSTSTSSSPPSTGPSHNRYAHIRAPPQPGKRPEKLRFNLALLFTEDGTEYSIQEARARSMGLLGKKWGPPPPSELPRTSVRFDAKDDGGKNTRNLTRRGFNGYSEPTVTLATKEALADVFGMYNSPDKSMKFGPAVGSKHAPVKKIELDQIAPMNLHASFKSVRSENGPIEGSSLGAPFKPFVDENVRKENGTPAPPKFKPFVDQPQPPLPSTTPEPGRDRRVLSTKETLPPPTARFENAPPPKTPNVLKPMATTESKKAVFTTPATAQALSRKDIFVDEEKPQPSATKIKPFVDQKPPQPAFKVFSRPPSSTASTVSSSSTVTSAPASGSAPLQQKNVLKPKPFLDSLGQPRQPFMPTRSVSSSHGERDRIPSISTSSSSASSRSPIDEPMPQNNAEDDYYDESSTTTDLSSDIDDTPNNGLVQPGTVAEEDVSLYDEEYDEIGGQGGQYDAPLGGRLGQFNVMTPITERTYEFTNSTRGGFITPSNSLGGAPGRPFEIHRDPVEVAAELAAELQREDDDEDEDDDAMKHIEERTGTLSLSDALTLASKFNPPNPCNPFDPTVMSTLLSIIPPGDKKFVDLRNIESGQLDGLQKFAKRKESKEKRRGSGNTTTSSKSGLDEEMTDVKLGTDGRLYRVRGKLGEGGFGAVFEAIDVQALHDKRKHHSEDGDELSDEDESFDEDDEATIPKVALKIVRPRNLWEFHVLRRIHKTLPAQIRQSIISPEALYAYKDESFLVLELCGQGTLLDVVNKAGQAGITQQGACLDELLVIFFSIELLRLIETLHRHGFIHGDVKIDNCLIRLEDVPGPATNWSSVYSPTGEGGWSHKGIKMIDFGRTIDTSLFPPHQTFSGDWPTDARDCLEMREGKSWSYQTDYFGLAGIIYCMLYGKYIEASSVIPAPPSSDGHPRYKLSTSFKRYWQTDIWTRLFDLLLNSSLARADGQLPLCDEIGSLRVEMESWLQANCNRASNSLKGLLKKVALSMLGGKG
ncbi:Mitotic spindle checkpoint protein Bub1/Mad3 [Abortiporus biennis]